jgi:acetone carboxylase gamma subunit
MTMTQSRVVQCSCGTCVNIAQDIKPAKCPKCYAEIAYSNGFYYANGKPVATVRKYFPSELKYFASEYPKIGQAVMIIWDDNQVYPFYIWNKTFQEDYEEHYKEMLGTKPNNIFQWLGEK